MLLLIKKYTLHHLKKKFKTSSGIKLLYCVPTVYLISNKVGIINTRLQI